MLKIVFTEKSAVLHALPVQHIASYCIVAQDARRPLAELCGADRVHTVSNADNSVEIIELSHIILAI